MREGSRPPPRTRAECRHRLAALLDQADHRGLDSLSDRQLGDLGKLYRAAATHLAQARTFGGSTRRKEALNVLVGRAHAAVYGRNPRGAGRWRLWQQLAAVPMTVRRSWPYHLLAAAILVLAVLYGFAGAAAEPDWVFEFTFAGDERTPYATRDELLGTLRRGRDGAVGAEEHAAFAALLWQNNTRVALLSFFLGFLACIPTVVLLVRNGTMLGTYTWVFHDRDLAGEWWAWILPHGITELLAIVLLAGGGLWIGRLVVAPGEQSRHEAFRAVRGDLLRLVLLAFPMLLLAALLESFVRQSTLGDTARYAIAAATALLWIGFLGWGRAPRAAAAAAAADTTARRRIPLPSDAELIGLRAPRRAAAPGSG